MNPLGTGEVFPVEEDEQAAKKSQGDGEDEFEGVNLPKAKAMTVPRTKVY